MTQEDLDQLAWGLSPDWDMECDRLLRAAVAQVADREEPQEHVVLILDKVRLIPLKGGAVSIEIVFFFVKKNVNVYTSFCLVSFVVPSEAAVGEHVRLEVALRQQDAVPALTDWTVPSKRGKIGHL